jgi:hypothetical protein
VRATADFAIYFHPGIVKPALFWGGLRLVLEEPWQVKGKPVARPGKVCRVRIVSADVVNLVLESMPLKSAVSERRN